MIRYKFINANSAYPGSFSAVGGISNGFYADASLSSLERELLLFLVDSRRCFLGGGGAKHELLLFKQKLSLR